MLGDSVRERALGSTGNWTDSYPSRENVLRMAVEGRRRDRGLLGSSLGQPFGPDQEIISIGDTCCFQMRVGSANRYLVRGLAVLADDSRPLGGFFGIPMEVKKGSDLLFTMPYASAQGDLVDLPLALASPPGISEWSAPQGATVAGGSGTTYELTMSVFEIEGDTDATRGGVTLSRIFGHNFGVTAHDTQYFDTPAGGVTFANEGTGDVDMVIPHMAMVGEPLIAMASNVGQTSVSGYHTVGSASSKVVTQAFVTARGTDTHRLVGIGVDFHSSADETTFPAGPDEVAVAVYTAHADGKPDQKLYDLISPDDYRGGLLFFEAPAGATLKANTQYVMVWGYVKGQWHRLRRTNTNGEDGNTYSSTGAHVRDEFFEGPDLASLSENSNELKIAVYTSVVNSPATGLPVVRPADDLLGFLQADLSGIADANGLPDLLDFQYLWIRIDGSTGIETTVGINAGRYQLTAADLDQMIKVRVSFEDDGGAWEVLTSEAYGPVTQNELTTPDIRALVSNLRQTPAATAEISKDYALGFRLGKHGQGYEISAVEIDLAAAPSDLTVSLWQGSHADHHDGREAQRKVFEFTNPSEFRVGRNRFTAPAGNLVFPNINYWIVLTGFGSSLSIRETTSENEDAGREAGAVIFDVAKERTAGTTGPWRRQIDPGTTTDSEDDVDLEPWPSSRNPVLRMAVEGSKRDYGLLGSSFGQDWEGGQEIISVGDICCFEFRTGSADRYLISRVTIQGDNTTIDGGWFGLPLNLRKGSDTLFSMPFASALGDSRYGYLRLTSGGGLSEWTAPQGATVPGGSSNTYNLDMTIGSIAGDAPFSRGGVVLTRVLGIQESDSVHDPDYYDAPAGGVTFGQTSGSDVIMQVPFMAIVGEPLNAMVDNFGQADNGFVSVHETTSVVAQGFTTGDGDYAHRLQGIGVNLEGSTNEDSIRQVPGGPDSVLVSIYASASGRLSEKLFDLISPDRYQPGHIFFEAPPNAALKPNTFYFVVWTHLDGESHRLQKTTSNNEDSGKLTGSSIGNDLWRGADLGNLAIDSAGNSMEIVVYTETLAERNRFVEGGIPVPLDWLHIPENSRVGDQFRVVFVTHHGIDATSSDIATYDELVQFEAAGHTKRYPTAQITNRFIRRAADQFKAVVCTADTDAREHTRIAEADHLPIRWLDGGWQDRPTLIANSYEDFFSGVWVNHEWGAYAFGNSAYFYPSHFHSVSGGHMLWTGCDAHGMAHPQFSMGASTGQVAVGTPRDKGANNTPLGALNVNSGPVTHNANQFLQIFGISPVFTVVD